MSWHGVEPERGGGLGWDRCRGVATLLTEGRRWGGGGVLFYNMIVCDSRAVCCVPRRGPRPGAPRAAMRGKLQRRDPQRTTRAAAYAEQMNLEA